MATRRERIVLAMGDHESFSGSMAAAVEAARVMGNRWALDSATWEPHDWSDFR